MCLRSVLTCNHARVVCFLTNNALYAIVDSNTILPYFVSGIPGIGGWIISWPTVVLMPPDGTYLDGRTDRRSETDPGGRCPLSTRLDHIP